MRRPDSLTGCPHSPKRPSSSSTSVSRIFLPYPLSLTDSGSAFYQSIPAVSPSPDKVHALYSFLSSTYRAARTTLHSFVDRQIADARVRARTGEGGRSLLDSVVAKELKEEDELDGVEMRDEVMNFLIAVSPSSSADR